MADFTYDLPFSENELLKILFKELKRKNENDIALLLRGAKLYVENTGKYSHYVGGGRSDAFAVFIQIYINPNNLETLNDPKIRKEITDICDRVIPPNVGFDVKSTNFFPDYSLEDEDNVDLVEDLVSLTKGTTKTIKALLTTDLLNKCFEMSETYIYMYAIENTLRIFIENVCLKKYGEDYLSKINLTKPVVNKINNRKTDILDKKWLSLKRSSDIYLLDFVELGLIIKVNWNDFKEYFPSQDFIIPKIDEIADVRNRIAHNSYIGEIERAMLKTYYNMILAQISNSLN